MYWCLLLTSGVISLRSAILKPSSDNPKKWRLWGPWREVLPMTSTTSLPPSSVSPNWQKTTSPRESRARQRLDRVRTAGLRGRDIVRQMLAFSRKTEQKKKPLKLSAIISESIDLLRASIPTTINIGVAVKSESGFILGKPIQIQQILLNLCGNAAYAMREKGGTLEIELSDYCVPLGTNRNFT